ncbi:ras-domain-containing protein [Fomitiporia mediterranea MF3/22]|uniref:ras-domain-containing protein n=1 Tax=Fomitiporia mediterranea (strain MF3/22) TaxID=694068 RepID=UPI0004407EEF|nr:ras-domain-containing protein [Fomitiporia mediterranea MF3/22]EJD04593.1 ras-domain-containing protein [Fomitiporia mediterranea MF3/22]
MRTIKLVIIGDSGVGKTSLRNQYIMGRFSTGYRATIGTDFITKTVPHYLNPEESVTLQIWDTAGQERFSSLSTAFFRGADAALLMFDVNRPETLSALTKWWDSFKAHAPVPDEEAEDFCCVVVGNKIDLVADADTEPVPNGNASGQKHTRVSEAEAERFLEELVPRTSTLDEEGEYEYDYDDPFVEGLEQDQSRRTTGFFMRRSLSGFSLHSVTNSTSQPDNADKTDDNDTESPPRIPSESIAIQPGSSNYLHSLRKGPLKSLSSDRSLGGTMTTTHTTQTIYHTPSSSLFDAYESAPSSPLQSNHNDLPPSPDSASSSKPATPAKRGPRRMTSMSSSSSAPTITPSLFMRTQASSSTSAAATPPTPIETSSSDFPFASVTAGRSRRRSSPLPPRPERRPRLFLTSAKTGTGVTPVFEYIARRVCMQWVYTEALEARALNGRETSAAADTLRLGLSGPASESRLAVFKERFSGSSCCGS